MKEPDALRILDAAANAPEKIKAFAAVAKQLGVPANTVYHWWWSRKIPRGRLSVFDLLKKRRAA